MKMPDNNLLLGEMVLVDKASNRKNSPNNIGQIVSVTRGENTVMVEFPNGERSAFHKNELLHLYPQRVIMQGLVSNLDMADKNFRTILKVFKLLSDRKPREALLHAATNVTTRFYCLTDSVHWQELQIRRKNNRKLMR